MRSSAEAQTAGLTNVPVLPSESEIEQHELTQFAISEMVTTVHRAARPGGVSKFATDYMFTHQSTSQLTMTD